MRKDNPQKSIEVSPSQGNFLASPLTVITEFILLLLVALFCVRQLASPDIGFHLKAGQWIAAHLQIPSKDTFTYTVPGNDYIDLHWLYQLMVYLVNSLAGETGIVLSNAMIVAGSFLLLLIRMKKKAGCRPVYATHVFFFISVVAVAVNFEPRPHAMSWLYLNLLLWILDLYDENRPRALLLLPMIMLLWVNTHSLFILGCVVIGCAWIGTAWKKRKFWFPLTYYTVVSILVCFMNPYGWKGVVYPFRQLQLLGSQNVFNSAIAELASPLNLESYFVNGRFILFQPLFAFHVFLLLSLFLFIRFLKYRTLTEVLLYGAFLAVGISGVKNIGYFVFVAAPLLIKDFSHCSKNTSEVQQSRSILLQIKTWTRSIVYQGIISFMIIVLSLFIMFSLITDKYYIYIRSNDRFGTHYNSLVLPIHAVQFLRAHHLEGKILNHLNFGGFLMNTLSQPVSVDGRNEVMGEKFYAEYSALWASPDKRPLLQKYHPEIIIFSPVYEFSWVAYLRTDSTWRLAFVDEAAALYLKVEYAPEIPTITEQSMLIGYKQIQPDSIDVELRRQNPPKNSFLSLQQEYFPQKEICISTFCYYNNWYTSACQIGLNGLKSATVLCPEMYFNLGNYFFEMRQFERATYCYERFLETNSDPLARARALAFHQQIIQ